MRFRILGPVEVVDGDRDVTPAGRRQRAVLAVLLVNANQTTAVDQLLHALWADTHARLSGRLTLRR